MIVWMINMTITNNFPGATMRPCFNGYQLQSKFEDHQNIIWLFIKSRDDPKMLHNYPEKRIEKWSKFLLIDFKFNIIFFSSFDDLWHDSWQLVEVLRNTERKIREEISSFLAGSDSSTSQYCEIIQNKLALLQHTWHEYLSENCPKFSQWNSAPCSSPSLSLFTIQKKLTRRRHEIANFQENYQHHNGKFIALPCFLHSSLVNCSWGS